MTLVQCLFTCRAVEAGQCLHQMVLETPPSLRTLPQTQPMNQFLSCLFQNARFNVIVSSLNHDFENRVLSHNPIFRINRTPYWKSLFLAKARVFFVDLFSHPYAGLKYQFWKSIFSVRRLFENFGFTQRQQHTYGGNV